MSDQLKGREVLRIIHAIANEKRLPEDTIFSAVEKALASVTEKELEDCALIRVTLDRDTGESSYFRQWQVVEDDHELTEEDEGKVIGLTEAKEKSPEIELGEYLEEPVNSEHGRISAHYAGQIVARIVREAERAQIALEYQDKIGTLVAGQVKQVTRHAIIVELMDHIEACVLRTHLLPREIYRVGDQISGYLYAVDPEVRGPMVFISRTMPEVVTVLFQSEVPEVQEGSVDIRAVARDPGVRAKVAVKTNDSRIDAVGACVGMRGSRVQTVSGELRGERIDVIEWSDDVAELMINAFAPVEISAVEMDEATQTMDVGVDSELLSKAIGRNGQNVRLVSDLIGWNLNVMSVEEVGNKSVDTSQMVVDRFAEVLSIDEDMATILAREGFQHVEEIAYIELESLAQIEEFDEDIAEALQERARSALLAQAMSTSAEPEESLLSLPSMGRELAYRLAEQKITTSELLAELSVDELVEQVGVDEALAGSLIMEARRPWFDQENKEGE